VGNVNNNNHKKAGDKLKANTNITGMTPTTYGNINKNIVTKNETINIKYSFIIII
jgi:hypothetical protein